MSRQELQRLRKELVRKLKDVTANAAKRRELSAERSTDAVDEAQSEISVELAVRTMNIGWETEKAVEAALDRVEAGEYGICASCGPTGTSS